MKNAPKDEPMTPAETARLVRQLQAGRISYRTFWRKVCGLPARKGA